MEFNNLKFNNNDLSFDIEKIKNFDPPITISKSFEDLFEYPHGIDVEDTSYWYFNTKERDEDFEMLKKMFYKFNFVE